MDLEPVYVSFDDASEAAAPSSRPLRRVWAPLALALGLTLAAAGPVMLLRHQQTGLLPPGPTVQQLIEVPSRARHPAKDPVTM